jgi:Tol biopolymer transport system component
VIINVTLGADGASSAPDVSNDGRFVVFHSEAGNLAAGAPEGGALVADLATARTWSVGERDEVDQNPVMPERVRISGDGQFVFFRSNRALTDDDVDDVEDVYRTRRNGSQLRLASIADPTEGFYGFSEFDVSDDGQRIVFQEMPTLDDGYSARRSFLGDLESLQVALQIAPGTPDEYYYSIWRPTISGDARRIAFDARALPDIPPGEAHVYAQDQPLGWLRLASGSAGAVGNAISYAAALSSDGSVVAFQSQATNLVSDDLNGLQDVFVHEFSSLKTTRVSVASDGREGDHHSYQPTLSADGRYVAFLSLASNLVPGDLNDKLDVFVHDRSTHVTQRVSVSTKGGGAGDTCVPSATLNCASPALSADGSIVVFDSDAGDLVSGSAPGKRDIYWVRWQALPIP